MVPFPEGSAEPRTPVVLDVDLWQKGIEKGVDSP
jgi:hypothetical protein